MQSSRSEGNHICASYSYLSLIVQSGSPIKTIRGKETSSVCLFGYHHPQHLCGDNVFVKSFVFFSRHGNQSLVWKPVDRKGIRFVCLHLQRFVCLHLQIFVCLHLQRFVCLHLQIFVCLHLQMQNITDNDLNVAM